MPPEELVRFNTLGKAANVLSMHPDATVIASDQLAICDNLVLGKPGNIEAACKQLSFLSGQRVTFLTSLAIISEHSVQYETIPFDVCFRQLTDTEVRTYVETEQPLDCAGSFKSEGLGISLFERLQGDDTTALIGLPLIRLCQWLEPLKRIKEKTA